MEVRKLRREEHGKTRKLWEDIFTEDTPEFLDYYYSVKTAENDIYVIEDGKKIISMLHLNPYQLQIGKNIVNGHYIVAVATDENYRRRGLMAKLLKTAIHDMRENGEPFTFLMPAAEAIYYPHGFRYIYRQKQGNISGKAILDSGLQIEQASKNDCFMLAEFANEFIEKKYDVFARRDSHYYEVVLNEQVSENGGIILIKDKDKLIGCFMYAKGEEYEIREPLFLDEYEAVFEQAVYSLTQDEHVEVKCLAYGAEDKPMIMAKVLDIPKLFECMEAEEEINLCLEVCDEPEGELLGRFHISGKEQLKVKEIPESKDVFKISIGMLTSLIFGYLSIETEVLAEKFKREWKKIKPLDTIFLNEIV